MVTMCSVQCVPAERRTLESCFSVTKLAHWLGGRENWFLAIMEKGKRTHIIYRPVWRRQPQVASYSFVRSQKIKKILNQESSAWYTASSCLAVITFYTLFFVVFFLVLYQALIIQKWGTDTCPSQLLFQSTRCKLESSERKKS